MTEFATTYGKTVVLPAGVIVTDDGAATVNGEPSEHVRVCFADDGTVYRVLARVIEALPEVTPRASLPGGQQALAIQDYRRKRAAYLEACKREDEAFNRWFVKRQRGERTNAAAASRLANLANYASADLASAQGALYALDLDPHDIDDADGVERTPLGGEGYS